ncbi:MAG TPA: hypothetical protein VEU77_10025 [Candidatus Acidoferrales bacterium]|nr:hypothetical protein [Candidatus Acidoferrales bacterium]
MIELLTSDPGILLVTATGLVVTALSIVRDTRAQRITAAQEASLAVVAEAPAPEPMELAA